MCRHISTGLSELIFGHQHVNTIMDVSGDDELQTAVILRVRDVMDLGPDVLVLLQRLSLVVPAQLRLRVAGHSEGDAPVLVSLGLIQLHYRRRNWPRRKKRGKKGGGEEA